MATSRYIAEKRCCICGRKWPPGRVIELDADGHALWPPTCGDPECDHQALGVDILDRDDLRIRKDEDR